jgi:hypothetical protein
VALERRCGARERRRDIVARVRSTRFFVAIAVAGAALVLFVVAREIDAAERHDYAEIIAEQPGRPATVTRLMHTKQFETIVRVSLGGAEHDIGIRRGADGVDFGATVMVHADPSDPGELAIAGTEKFTWWGAMTSVFVAAGVVALLAAAWFGGIAPTGAGRSASRASDP